MQLKPWKTQVLDNAKSLDETKSGHFPPFHLLLIEQQTHPVLKMAEDRILLGHKIHVGVADKPCLGGLQERLRGWSHRQ